ncbi:MAG: formylglycine-generating enzyme family protein [Kiritimatiellae bacterium]|nr:formylglycine-generating enzyme family protein [Kiritimatiellia bacterium]MBQ7213239.1 formylglycine-generating enzyme family protein [Bacteroidales bacterium]
MKPSCILFFVAFAAAASHATVPTATITGVSTDAATHVVTVTYTLSGPAIVTTDFLTNGVSVGAANFSTLYGDVNRYVTNVTSSCSFKWLPGVHGDWQGGNFDVRLKTWSMNCPPDYMAVDLVATNQIWFYVSEGAIPLGVQHVLYKSTRLLMRKIPAAGVTYRMGAPSTEIVNANEPVHLVKLTNDFYIGVFPVTQRQWKTMTEQNAVIGHRDESTHPQHWLYPVNNVSYNALRGSVADGIDWPTTARFAVAVNSHIQTIRSLTGISTMDLPTEAEWEYACRAGASGAHFDGSSMSLADTDEIGWYANNSAVGGTKQPHPVGLKKPNGWGLFDVLGNMHEWCMDWSGDYVFEDAAVATVAPKGAFSGTSRVKRGGGTYEHGIHHLRCAKRDAGMPDSSTEYNGFRLYCSIPVNP